MKKNYKLRHIKSYVNVGRIIFLILLSKYSSKMNINQWVDVNAIGTRPLIS